MWLRGNTMISLASCLLIKYDYCETEEDVVVFAKETYSLGVDHYDREDYINMGLLDDPYDE